MTRPLPVPIEIRRVGTHSVHIAWADQHRSEYPNRYLRDRCPCAACRGRKSLPLVGAQGGEIYPVQVGVVGRYALSIQWSDGHDSGIYSYATLRGLCPCATCQPAPAALAEKLA
jgi:DUF971 family protein